MAKKRIKDLDATATTSDLNDSNYLVLDGVDGTKKLPADKIADKPNTDTESPTWPPEYDGQIYIWQRGSSTFIPYIGLNGEWNRIFTNRVKDYWNSNNSLSNGSKDTNSVGYNTGDAEKPCVSDVSIECKTFTLDGTENYKMIDGTAGTHTISYEGSTISVSLPSKGTIVVVENNADYLWEIENALRYALYSKTQYIFLLSKILSVTPIPGTNAVLIHFYSTGNFTILGSSQTDVYFTALKKIPSTASYKPTNAFVTGSGATVGGNASFCISPGSGNVPASSSGLVGLGFVGSSSTSGQNYVFGTGICRGINSCFSFGIFNVIADEAKTVSVCGIRLLCNGNQQAVYGRFNIPRTGSDVGVIIGCGTSSDNMHNALEVGSDLVLKAMDGKYNIPCCKTGTTAPDTAPDYIGQEYLDTEQKKVYKAFGTTDASDWVLIN